MDDDATGRSLNFLSAHPVAQYLWLRENIQKADLAPSSEFRRRFIRFYQVRGLVGKHPDVLFNFLGDVRDRNPLPPFADAIAEFAERLHETTKDKKLRAEASFTSKVLATLDPDLPVIDKSLLDHFGLRIHRHKKDRMVEAARVYDELHINMRNHIQSRWWSEARRRFNERFPSEAARITDMKALDFLIWGDK